MTEVKREISRGVKPARRTIFHDLIDPAPLVDEDFAVKAREPLSDVAVFADAVNVTGAGAETTGSTAGRAIFEVLHNPEVHRKLHQELCDAFPDPAGINLLALEKLPYLGGVIKEALRHVAVPGVQARYRTKLTLGRLNPGLPGHLPRVVPPSGAVFDGLALPPGTVVSMSAWLMHHDAAAFRPDPAAFDPDRWTNPTESKEKADQIRARDKCMVPFGKGSRNCLGQTLAMCELHYTIESIFRLYEPGTLAIHPDFGREDLELTELLLGYHPRKARKFRIVKGVPVGEVVREIQGA